MRHVSDLHHHHARHSYPAYHCPSLPTGQFALHSACVNIPRWGSTTADEPRCLATCLGKHSPTNVRRYEGTSYESAAIFHTCKPGKEMWSPEYEPVRNPSSHPSLRTTYGACGPPHKLFTSNHPPRPLNCICCKVQRIRRSAAATIAAHPLSGFLSPPPPLQ